MKKFEIPEAEDETEFFIPTLNNTGYVLSHLDELSQEFIEYAVSQKGKALELGAGYGLATLTALSRGVEIYCNDIEPKHINIINQLAEAKNYHLLTTICGSFPDEINFPENYFSVILISRVIHLLDGEHIEKSFEKIYQWLKPKGRVFVVADTPYLKNFEKFIPEYEQRVKKGEKWPGLIENTADYLNKSQNNIPRLVHLLDKSVIERLLIKYGFKIIKLSFMNRTDYPKDRRYDGHESIGAVAAKPGS